MALPPGHTAICRAPDQAFDELGTMHQIHGDVIIINDKGLCGVT
jgi:hypothetical protein